jgi:hypothetical protein
MAVSPPQAALCRPAQRPLWFIQRADDESKILART